MHELDELSHANLQFEKELITGIPLWTYRAGKQPAKLWIPASQRELDFNFAHCQTHPGKRETKRLCKERYFWKGLPTDVEQFYKRCPICCQENSRRPRLALQPFQVPERMFAIVHIDLVSFGHDRKDRRYVYALTLVDRWTRHMSMCPLLDMTNKTVVSAIEHNWIQYFGVMSILVSDQGPQCRGTEFQAFYECWGIKHNFSLAYSPSGNGCNPITHKQTR